MKKQSLHLVLKKIIEHKLLHYSIIGSLWLISVSVSVSFQQIQETPSIPSYFIVLVEFGSSTGYFLCCGAYRFRVIDKFLRVLRYLQISTQLGEDIFSVIKL